MANEPITREEMLLNAVATGEATSLDPITREEMFLAKLGGADVNTPTPITRKEQFLQKAIENAGSGGSGGGAGGGFANGTMTFAEETSTSKYGESVSVTHGLGYIPQHFLFFILDSTSRSSSASHLLVGRSRSPFEYISSTNGGCTAFTASSSETDYQNLAYQFYTEENAGKIFSAAEANEETIKIFYDGTVGGRRGGKIPAGSTIFWMVW